MKFEILLIGAKLKFCANYPDLPGHLNLCIGSGRCTVASHFISSMVTKHKLLTIIYLYGSGPPQVKMCVHVLSPQFDI